MCTPLRYALYLLQTTHSFMITSTNVDIMIATYPSKHLAALRVLQASALLVYGEFFLVAQRTRAAAWVSQMLKFSACRLWYYTLRTDHFKALFAKWQTNRNVK